MLTQVKELYISFSNCVVSKEELQTGLQIINALKCFNQIEIFYLDLTRNIYVFSILKSYLSKFDCLKMMRNVILKLDSCKILDAEVLNIQSLNTYSNLEQVIISLDNNKITEAAFQNFLVISQMLKL